MDKRYYYRQQTVSAIVDEIAFDDLIIVGAEVLHVETDERFRVLHAVAKGLEKRQMDYPATGIRHYIETQKDKCLAAGVCPYCGEDVTQETVTEHHGENRLGNAPERLTRWTCPNGCEEG